MTSYMMQNSVSVDGTCSSREWSDSMGMGMEMGGGMMGQQNSEVRIKHDQNFVYMVIEAVEDSSPSVGDMAWVAFDTSHNGGQPGSDDHAFAMHWTSSDTYGTAMHQGNGTGWGSAMPPAQGILEASGMSSTNCPQGGGHLMYEMRIPRSVLGQGSSMGMMAYAFDGFTRSGMRWPAGDSLEKLNQMGDLSFSDTSMGGAGSPIPGYPVESIVAGLGFGLLITLTSRRRRRR